MADRGRRTTHRQGHLGDPFAAAAQEYRLWLAAAGALQAGTQVTVDSEWGWLTGVVVEMPFVDPQKRTPVG
jgi:hypothetical protein